MKFTDLNPIDRSSFASQPRPEQETLSIIKQETFGPSMSNKKPNSLEVKKNGVSGHHSASKSPNSQNTKRINLQPPTERKPLPIEPFDSCIPVEEKLKLKQIEREVKENIC